MSPFSVINNRIKLLLLDSEPHSLNTLTQRLDLRDFDVTSAGTCEEAVESARWQDFDLALVNPRTPGLREDQVLRTLVREQPLLEVVLLAADGEDPLPAPGGDAPRLLRRPVETLELFRVLREAYQRRVQRKHALSDEQLLKLLAPALNESPQSILRKLRAIDVAPRERRASAISATTP